MRCAVVLGVLWGIFGISSFSVWAQDFAPGMDTSMLMDLYDRGESLLPKTDDRKAIEVQSFFIDQLFLSYIFNSSEDASLLTEEELAEYGDSTNQELFDQLMRRQLSDILAKQDVLGMKKMLMKSSSQLPDNARQSYQFNPLESF